MEETGQEYIRLNKYLSDAGFCSRREADRLMEEGKVVVDGAKAVPGMKILPEAKVTVDGAPVKKEQKKVLLALNKPAGIVCTAQKKEKKNVVDFVNYPVRVYPVGRLDKDSTGLLLLTNDGALVNKIMRAGNYHEKEYIVTVDKAITPSFCRKMASGVAILDTVTRSCKVEQLGDKKFRIILTQGLNRQIRRMCEALGYRVKTLMRVRIMNIKLGNLPVGAVRMIEGAEKKELERMLAQSSSLSVKQRLGQGETSGDTGKSVREAGDTKEAERSTAHTGRQVRKSSR